MPEIGGLGMKTLSFVLFLTVSFHSTAVAQEKAPASFDANELLHQADILTTDIYEWLDENAKRVVPNECEENMADLIEGNLAYKAPIFFKVAVASKWSEGLLCMVETLHPEKRWWNGKRELDSHNFSLQHFVKMALPFVDAANPIPGLEGVFFYRWQPAIDHKLKAWPKIYGSFHSMRKALSNTLNVLRRHRSELNPEQKSDLDYLIGTNTNTFLQINILDAPEKVLITNHGDVVGPAERGLAWWEKVPAGVNGSTIPSLDPTEAVEVYEVDRWFSRNAVSVY